MNKCLECQQETLNPRFCSKNCSAVFNNRISVKRPRTKKCKACGTNILRSRTFCNECFSNIAFVRRRNYVKLWLEGKVKGGNGFNVSHYVIDYLKALSNNCCSKCGWSGVNVHTGRVCLEINHINNDPFNHSPHNLEVLCPNCHALVTLPALSTKGKGRYSRSINHPSSLV